MRDPNGFDELVRRKLDEREFPFDAAHWADMERLLSERRRRRYPWLPWTVSAAVLLGGAAIWWTSGTDALPAASAPVVATVGSQPASVQTPSVDVGEGNSVQESIRPSGEATSDLVSSRSIAGQAGPTVSRSSDAPHRAAPTGTYGEKASRTLPPENKSAIPVEVQGSFAVYEANGSASSIGPATDAPSGPDVATVNDHGDDGTVPGTNDNSSVAEPVAHGGASGPPDTTEGTTPPNATGTAAPASDAAADPVISPAQASDTLPATPDPSASAAPTPAPWLAIRSTFEFTGLVGLFSTTSAYDGGGTEQWSSTVERQTTPGFGLEGMWNVSGHFSIGTGAHYTAYSERLVSEAVQRTDQILTNSYFWTPVDTMVLAVVDTIQIGAVDYYVTELVPTTIDVSGQTTDTSYATTIVREPREVVNRVSYVEFPLLMDAHLSCGRWVFGARGGPTFGLLTSVQGSVPGDTESGYMDLDERTFSSMTLGSTARAYARYRINASWSIGLEPTYRTQLDNAFGDGDEQRRSSAVGAYLSVSYRFGGRTMVP